MKRRISLAAAAHRDGRPHLSNELSGRSNCRVRVICTATEAGTNGQWCRGGRRLCRLCCRAAWASGVSLLATELVGVCACWSDAGACHWCPPNWPDHLHAHLLPGVAALGPSVASWRSRCCNLRRAGWCLRPGAATNVGRPPSPLCRDAAPPMRHALQNTGELRRSCNQVSRSWQARAGKPVQAWGDPGCWLAE